MFRFAALLLLVVVAVRANANEESFCARRGYTLPCIPLPGRPMNITKLNEYLLAGRNVTQARDDCAAMGVYTAQYVGWHRLLHAARSIIRMGYYTLALHPDAELCARFIDQDALYVSFLTIWTPLSLAWIYIVWEQKNQAIEAKRKSE